MADRDLSGRTLGEFVLCEQIAQGGFCSVYRSEQPLLKRDVVVKVLQKKVLQKKDDTAEQRFLREARLASRFDHPFTAHVYAFGVDADEDLLWMAMELVPGITLTSWLAQHGPMPLEQFVPFFECVADAVHAAHECGIVHRDLKPSNVMVIERGSRLLPKLLDFGIAKALDGDGPHADPPPPEQDGGDGIITSRIRLASQVVHRIGTDPGRSKRRRITRTGVGFGSRPYMSPEQWNDAQAVGPASDVYSLGVVAYEALTGRLPYTATSSEEFYRLHCRAELPSLGAGFSPDLDRVIACAMAKSPDHRYRSALEMAAELREALQAQPREQLRSLARVWNDRARPPTLLLRGGDLMHTSEAVGELERAFVTASHRRTNQLAWARRCLLASAAALVLGAVWYQGQQETRAAHQLADATRTQAELEQGRAALLHHEPEAQHHLAEAYRRDRSPATAFMLARAIQPRLAEKAQLASSFERMWSAQFSPAGTQIVTTDDRNAQIWDARSYRQLFTLGHGDIVYHAIYSADGALLITGSGDGAVRIWDPRTGHLLRELRRDLTRRYYVVALSPDGTLVAGLGAGVADVWNASTGAFVTALHDDTASTFPSLAFSPDGRWLAMGTGNGVQIVDTKAWSRARHIPGPGIHGLAWDPTATRIVTGSADGSAAIWAIPSGERVHQLRPPGDPIDAVAFSPDGQLVVAGSHDGDVQVWSAASGSLHSRGNQLRNKILFVEFDRSSSLLVAASASGSVVVSDAASGMPVSVLEGPTAVVRVVHFDPSSQRVIGASWDGTARIWDARAPYRAWSSAPLGDGCGLLVGGDPDRRFLAVPCYDQPTRIWDTAKGRLVAELPSVTPVAGDFASPYPVVSAAGDRAAIARGNQVAIYELPTARLLRTVQHDAPVSTVAFAARGGDLVSGSIDGAVLVTRDDGARTTLAISSAAIDAVGVLPDGRLIVADARRHLRIHAPGGAIDADLTTQARVAMLRVSPDSRRLITVPIFTGKVAAPELWDTEHHRSLGALSVTGQGQVYSARFLAADQIVTACSDGALRLWAAEAGQLRQTYRGGSRFLVDATLSADGTMLIGGGGDGLLRFWELSSGRPLWTMPAHRSPIVGIHVEGTSIVTRGFSGDIARWSLPHPEQVIDACDHNRRCAIVTQ